MTNATRYLISFILLLGCAAFLYGVWKACFLSWTSTGYPDQMPVFLSGVVTTMAAVFSTNLGAVLGISITQPSSAFRIKGAWNPLNLFTSPTPTVVQTTACYIYILSLIAAAIVWAKRDFDPDANHLVPLIPVLTKSLLGVMLGLIAVSYS